MIIFKKILTRILPAALLLAASSCGNIAPDERYIDVPPAEARRTVLLEDFTGQGCSNCPAAHRKIEELERQYGDRLVAVSIHAGTFGVPADNKRYTGLMQPEGQVFNDRYGISEYPQGVVDGRGPMNSDQWATAVYDAVEQTTPLTISLSAALDGTEIAIDCEVESTAALSGNLSLWVIESGIIARQEDEERGRIPDYPHNNVFRACANGIDGQGLSLNPGEPRAVTCRVPLRATETETWKPENLAIVAFVKKGSSVMQAAKCPVILPETNE